MNVSRVPNNEGVGLNKWSLENRTHQSMLLLDTCELEHKPKKIHSNRVHCCFS